MPRPLATSRTGIEPCPFLFPDVAFRYGLIQRTCWLAGAPGLWVSCSWDHRSHGHVCFLCTLDQLKGTKPASSQLGGRGKPAQWEKLHTASTAVQTWGEAAPGPRWFPQAQPHSLTHAPAQGSSSSAHPQSGPCCPHCTWGAKTGGVGRGWSQKLTGTCPPTPSHFSPGPDLPIPAS